MYDRCWCRSSSILQSNSLWMWQCGTECAAVEGGDKFSSKRNVFQIKTPIIIHGVCKPNLKTLYIQKHYQKHNWPRVLSLYLESSVLNILNLPPVGSKESVDSNVESAVDIAVADTGFYSLSSDCATYNNYHRFGLASVWAHRQKRCRSCKLPW